MLEPRKTNLCLGTTHNEGCQENKATAVHPSTQKRSAQSLYICDVLVKW